ncbi:hypothetical protein FGO68_gene3401 [Halteria grandinella]|uniref:Uncharacterized protein n=1 Tax=Halteria grandinella TaxID=5974 RepID=A0A8J8NI85_HALGN|nr:hypothetical protein FGO68_gene3401 [Halteria grandinella]
MFYGIRIFEEIITNMKPLTQSALALYVGICLASELDANTCGWCVQQQNYWDSTSQKCLSQVQADTITDFFGCIEQNQLPNQRMIGSLVWNDASQFDGVAVQQYPYSFTPKQANREVLYTFANNLSEEVRLSLRCYLDMQVFAYLGDGHNGNLTGIALPCEGSYIIQPGQIGGVDLISPIIQQGANFVLKAELTSGKSHLVLILAISAAALVIIAAVVYAYWRKKKIQARQEVQLLE